MTFSYCSKPSFAIVNHSRRRQFFIFCNISPISLSWL